MGREIRRVPEGWKHPQDARGYTPMFNKDFETAVKEAEEWDEEPPTDPTYYRPAWSEAEMTHYQVYETVSEGTPISPVFATLNEVEDWLIEQGHSRKAAQEFCQDGWAPSFVMVANKKTGQRDMWGGIDALEFLP